MDTFKDDQMTDIEGTPLESNCETLFSPVFLTMTYEDCDKAT